MAPSPRLRSLLGVGGGIVVGAAVVLSVLFVSTAGTIVVDGHLYAYETEDLFGSQSNLQFEFRGVSFTFHLWCSANPDVGVLCGNATEASGAVYPYSFGDGGPTLGTAPWQTWVAPGGQVGVEYQSGGTARLMVATN